MSPTPTIQTLVFIFLANLVGCAGIHDGGSETIPNAVIVLDTIANTAPYRLVISIHDQRMVLLRGVTPAANYLMSTAKSGAGEAVNSGTPPRGRHAIAEKIGAGVTIGTDFVDRIPTDKVIAVNTPGVMPVATRILRLRGLENKNWATFERLIYLHGSPVENLLGTPASGGCIRMRSAEIIGLFDLVSIDTEVFIYEEPLQTALKLLAASDARYAFLTSTAGVGVIQSIRQLCLGHGYGVNGIALNGRDALRWCSSGAQQNDPVSIALLAALHEEGKGVHINLIKAREMYKRSALLDNPHAQYKLSQMYASGRGGAQDDALAKEFLARAAQQGHTAAKALMQTEP